MTRDEVQQWLDRYVDAWRSYDADAIGELFSADAVYAYHPYDREPLRGRAAIVESWLSERDEPGSWDAHYEVTLLAGDQAIARGETSYADGPRVLEPVGAAVRRRRPLRGLRRVVHGPPALRWFFRRMRNDVRGVLCAPGPPHKFSPDAEVGRKERGHEMKGPPPISRRFAVAGVSSRFAGARGSQAVAFASFVRPGGAGECASCSACSQSTRGTFAPVCISDSRR